MIATGNRFNAPQRITRNTQNNRNNVAFGCNHYKEDNRIAYAIGTAIILGLGLMAGTTIHSEKSKENKIMQKAETAPAKLMRKIDSLRTELRKTNDNRTKRATDRERDLQSVVDSLNGGKTKPLTALTEEIKAYRIIDSISNVRDSLWKIAPKF